jgi:hypothetical protein
MLLLLKINSNLAGYRDWGRRSSLAGAYGAILLQILTQRRKGAEDAKVKKEEGGIFSHNDLMENHNAEAIKSNVVV